MKAHNRYESPGMLEILDGPCCESTDCEVRYLWPLDGETHDEFVARLTWTYSGRVMEIPA